MGPVLQPRGSVQQATRTYTFTNGEPARAVTFQSMLRISSPYWYSRTSAKFMPVDESLLVLSPTHQFLHLAVHGQKHSFSRLIWLVDLALVCRQVSWGELIEQARRTGTLRPVAYALSSIAGLFGTKVPQDVWEALPRLNWIERRFVTAVVGRRAAEPEGELLVALSIPSLVGKLAYLLEFAFPRPHVLAEVFPTTPAAWFYPRRAGEILAQGAAQLSGLFAKRAVEIPKAEVKRPG